MHATRSLCLLFPVLLVACGSSSSTSPSGGDSGATTSGDDASVPTADGSVPTKPGADGSSPPAATDGSTQPTTDGSTPPAGDGSTPLGTPAVIGGCAMFPANHIFNTPIDALPVDPQSSAYLATIGAHNFHLDLGTTVDPTKSTYYGIPYNVVHSSAAAWTQVAYTSTDPNMSWDPTSQADCAVGSAHSLTSPCTTAAAPAPLFPIPATPLVEGGIVTDPSQPYGDHHVLLLDADTCHLWELYHAYPVSSGGAAWDIFGSAYFDLRSNALRPDGWTSADAAGFPVLALLLRADEAATGKITHALRFTIQSSKIRNTYTWPARHLTTNGTSSTSLPPMGQLFRLKASYAIPATFGAQSKAILQAMKTYGLYIADGGSDMYVSGEPSAGWQGATFTEVQSVSNAEIEAVDLTPIAKRPGFDPNSAAVP